ncbi:DUF6090 family protein [Aegicerativicinus sediminis]|uniref:DUF6090 family protein n=1 Tax=Aegicerativicinus sediminis TaxID=2893202 RepID=UPI001E289E60|nr:DUF6090 family protein [Aegicerativicinus sediminis]
MIKFLRNIRRNLLSHGKTFNYLKYAIGEIILVMIGILLALQVNNWNENRKMRAFEKEILTLIDQNLSRDSILLSMERLKCYEGITYTDKLLEQVALANYSDTLNVWMGKIISFERFKSQSSAFEVLKSKGFESISDNELRLALISYYDESLFKLYESLNDVLQSFNTDWIPLIKEEFTDFKWTEYCIPVNAKDLFDKPSTIVLFKLFKDNRAGELRKMDSSLAEIHHIRNLIRTHKNE